MASVSIRLARKALVALQLESTGRGTYLALEAADVYEVTDLSWPTLSAEQISYNTLRNTFTRDPDAIKIGNLTGAITFTTAIPLATSTVTTFNTKFGQLFEACGTDSDVSSLTCSVTPADDSTSSLSMSFNVDGMEIRMRGCVGSFKQILNAGEFARVEWTFQGVIEDVLESAALAITSAVSVTPEIVESMGTFTFTPAAGTAGLACVASSELECGAETTAYKCMAGDKGIGFFFNSDRVSTLTLVTGPMYSGADAQLDDELYDAFENSTLVTVQCAHNATYDSPGLRYQFVGTISDLQLTELDGSVRWNIVISGAAAAAEGEFLIEYQSAAP